MTIIIIPLIGSSLPIKGFRAVVGGGNGTIYGVDPQIGLVSVHFDSRPKPQQKEMPQRVNNTIQQQFAIYY